MKALFIFLMLLVLFHSHMSKKLATTVTVLKRTLQFSISHEEVIQKSKFIVNICPAESIEQGMKFLEEVGDPKATHNCWAFRGKDENNYRIQDDGEPSGTAGKPILTAIDSMGLINTFAIVTRYFGGIKLGTGGLIRAYQGITRNCLEIAEGNGCFVDFIPHKTVTVTLPTETLGRCYRIISKFGRITSNLDLESETIEKQKEGEEYSSVESISVVMPNERVEEFYQSILDLTKGSAILRINE